MKNMTNQNVIQRGTQTTGQGFMIEMRSLGSLHKEAVRHPSSVRCSFPRRIKWTREDYKTLHCCFWSNPMLKEYRK